MSEINVLGIFAHPDDVELLSGGTLLKMKSLGYTTGCLDVTRGEMGTRGTPEIRAEEATDAAKILKFDIRENLNLPDGRVFANDDARTKLVRVLRRLKPKVILTHQLEDPHPDHDHIARLVRESARLSSIGNYDGNFGQERIDVPRIMHNLFSRHILPSFIVDISNFLGEKMDAARAHKSQFYDPSSNEPETRITGKEFLKDMENRSRYFGSLIGVKAGEPYYVREVLNVDDPVGLLTRPMNLYS